MPTPEVSGGGGQLSGILWLESGRSEFSKGTRLGQATDARLAGTVLVVCWPLAAGALVLQVMCGGSVGLILLPLFWHLPSLASREGGGSFPWEADGASTQSSSPEASGLLPPRSPGAEASSGRAAGHTAPWLFIPQVVLLTRATVVGTQTRSAS